MSSEWKLQAACRGLDPKESDRVFFPPEGPKKKDSSGDYAEALTFCNRCPVREQCLKTALDGERGAALGSRYGLFGGLTPRERWTIEKNEADGRRRKGIPRLRPWHHGKRDGWERGCRCEMCCAAWRRVNRGAA